MWVQAAIQGSPGDNFPMPFGGQGTGADFSASDNVVDPASPMMLDIPNPMEGNSASHVSYTGLPGPAHTVVINPNNNRPVLYDLQFGGNCGGTPTPTPTRQPHLLLQRRLLRQLHQAATDPTRGYSNTETSPNAGSETVAGAVRSGEREHCARGIQQLLDAFPRLRRVLSYLAETRNGDYETT